LIWSCQLEVFTFMTVNSNNKRQNYDNSWNHIEVCNEKWCYMTTHQVCSNSHTTREVVKQELLTLPEYLSSPPFYVDATILNKHDLQFLFPPNCFGLFFGSSYFFKWYLYLLVSYMISITADIKVEGGKCWPFCKTRVNRVLWKVHCVVTW
jgi:hypothetical protein